MKSLPSPVLEEPTLPPPAYIQFHSSPPPSAEPQRTKISLTRPHPIPPGNSSSGSSKSPTLTLLSPSHSATPSEIQTYISALLQKTRHLPPSRAQEIASRWQSGSGLQLRHTSAAGCRIIFGAEDGRMVYRDVRARYYHEEALRRKGDGRETDGRVRGAVLVLVSLALIGGGIAVGVVEKRRKTFGGAMIFFGLIGLFVGICFVCEMDGSMRSAEFKAEQELKKYWV